MISVRLIWTTSRVVGSLKPRGFRPKSTLIDKSVYTQPRDDKIKYTHVQVVTEDGKLEPPLRLSVLLDSLDRKKLTVQLIADDKPFVRILDREEQRQKAKALLKAKKAARQPPGEKEIQVTWGVAAADLIHKISKAREALLKKDRVNIVFAPKKRQPLLPPDERHAKVNEVLEMLKDVGMERAPRTLERSLLILHLQAKK